MAAGGKARAAPATAAVSAVHALRASSLLSRAVGKGALELEHSATDLVLDGGLALVVVDGRCGGSVVGAGGLGAAAEETTLAAGGGGGGSVAGSVRHDGGCGCCCLV